VPGAMAVIESVTKVSKEDT